MAVIAWHFLAEKDGKPVTRTGREMTVGDVEAVEGEIRLCDRGLHGSLRAIDALGYAPGSWVQRAEYSGTLVQEYDKFAASVRKCLALASADRVLHEFACWCAERALTRERAVGREPDQRSWQAIRVKREWLAGLATDDELDDAEKAAGDAAKAVACTPALAAKAAALKTAVVAARASAVAAWLAAVNAERTAQNEKLEAMLVVYGAPEAGR